SHHLVREVREPPAEELLAVENRPNDAGRMAHHEAHCGELELVQQPVPAVHSLESHASSSAASAGNSRLRDPPKAALTTHSNSWSSLYRPRSRATSSSVTL